MNHKAMVGALQHLIQTLHSMPHGEDTADGEMGRHTPTHDLSHKHASAVEKHHGMGMPKHAPHGEMEPHSDVTHPLADNDDGMAEGHFADHGDGDSDSDDEDLRKAALFLHAKKSY